MKSKSFLFYEPSQRVAQGEDLWKFPIGDDQEMITEIAARDLDVRRLHSAIYDTNLPSPVILWRVRPSYWACPWLVAGITKTDPSGTPQINFVVAGTYVLVVSPSPFGSKV
ncbi:hypothetical protein CISG_03059 [Coccidioides immitis RMSCC 3703]|uniref:Uncharacterized protein n=1 Tax=Coccidioides immitis RMSCC 3703 TaxID=454286 RepID=A0A0J8QIW3_COCIT|nr:hypothetical protein CISG_03059 [Coccidioides immitis RMSCC 3703]